MAMTGMRTKTTAEPKRPPATAPMPTGSSAYATAAQTRARTDLVSRRVARKAASPASGIAPIMMTSMASQGLPPSSVASTAMTAT